MKVQVLMENTTQREGMLTEHGLSLYIETKNHKILFDTGQSGQFAVNAEKMGIDLKEVDMAVLSHGHYDHGGGLLKFLELNEKAPVYLSKEAFVPHFNGPERYIGLDGKLQAFQDRFFFVEEELQIDEELRLCSCNHLERQFESYGEGLHMVKQGSFLSDDFHHEQYLLIHEGEKTVLVSGCSHKGILNIMTWLQADIVIGGFHFMKIDLETEEKDVLRLAAEQLKAYPTEYYTCHCTGLAQYGFLKEIMEGQLEYLSTGETLIV